MTEAEVAVLDAARRWVEAKEEALAVDEARAGNPVESERALDQAEYELTDAVYRMTGRPPPARCAAEPRNAPAVARSESWLAGPCLFA